MLELSFVKGHCGWDTATLLLADEIPEELQLRTALQVLDPPFDGGIEVGLLQADSRPGYLRLRVVDTTSRTWISMCGGITQLIGKALLETGFRDYFKLDGELDRSFDGYNGSCRLTLAADAGDFLVDIEVKDGSVLTVTTTMDAYAAYLYALGVQPTSIDGVPTLVVGEFLVFRIADLQLLHRGVDFTRRDPGPQLEILNGLLQAYQERSSHLNGVLAMLYDDAASGGGHFRVYPRFLGGDNSAARLLFEFQCGTGTVAVALALLHYGELPFDAAEGEAVFEWGNPSNTRDPYGIRTSVVRIGVADGRIRRIGFSHSVVEIIAEGKLSVPSGSIPDVTMLTKNKKM